MITVFIYSPTSFSTPSNSSYVSVLPLSWVYLSCSSVLPLSWLFLSWQPFIAYSCSSKSRNLYNFFIYIDRSATIVIRNPPLLSCCVTLRCRACNTDVPYAPYWACNIDVQYVPFWDHMPCRLFSVFIISCVSL